MGSSGELLPPDLAQTWLDPLRTGVPFGSQAASFFLRHPDGHQLADIDGGCGHRQDSWLLVHTARLPTGLGRSLLLSPTCAVGSLVGGLPFQAFVLALGQRRQLGGDLLLDGSWFVHLVGGADQLDGQLGLGGQRSHALLARRNLRRRL